MTAALEETDMSTSLLREDESTNRWNIWPLFLLSIFCLFVFKNKRVTRNRVRSFRFPSVWSRQWAKPVTVMHRDGSTCYYLRRINIWNKQNKQRPQSKPSLSPANRTPEEEEEDPRPPLFHHLHRLFVKKTFHLLNSCQRAQTATVSVRVEI